MIQIKEVGFSNMFSYGDDNVFTVGPNVTQLLGKNGDGKSSIATIIEELFFNKNSRGIKKADIPNRYSGAKGYSCFAKFSVHGVAYTIEKVVSTTTKLKLLKGKADCSGHTATQTYKLIEDLLGMDFNTFTKLVYQSMVSSLDFLSATDANRKKFLVSLLGLENYVEAEKTLKEAVKESKSEMASITGSLETVKSWIAKNGVIPEIAEPKTLPEKDKSINDILLKRKMELANANLHNTEVKKNLRNISNFESLVPVSPVLPPEEDSSVASKAVEVAKRDLAVQKSTSSAAASEVAKINSIKEKCHVCGSTLKVGNKSEMLATATTALQTLELSVQIATDNVNNLSKTLSVIEAEEKAHSKYVKYLNDLHNAELELDSSKPTELLKPELLSKTINTLENELKAVSKSISETIAYNTKVTASNATIEYKTEQLETFQSEMKLHEEVLKEATTINTRLDILAKALGTKGLIAYKVESMVKVFEGLINQYLQVLADGEFALGFSVEDTKLVLNTYSRGKLIDIRSLSSGEFNRVNTATLLAVRKMMTSISKTDINLLILDEVVSVLDQEGKDTLIDVLLKENNLSSIVVSHGYEHPLANKVTVTKTNNISRLDNE